MAYNRTRAAGWFLRVVSPSLATDRPAALILGGTCSMAARTRYAADLPADPDLNWVRVHVPLANSRAAAIRIAQPGIRHVCTGITASLVADATTAPAAVRLSVTVLDGNLDGGPVLWQRYMVLPGMAAGAARPIEISGLAIPGTAGSAMTLQFDAAGGVNTFQSVVLTGFSVEV